VQFVLFGHSIVSSHMIFQQILFNNSYYFHAFHRCQPYIACSSESKEGFCEHVDTTCSPMNICRTCSSFKVSLSLQQWMAIRLNHGLHSFNRRREEVAEQSSITPMPQLLNMEQSILTLTTLLIIVSTKSKWRYMHVVQ
jgi:hypothetical protein